MLKFVLETESLVVVMIGNLDAFFVNIANAVTGENRDGLKYKPI
jgi:hypothetical protein